MSVDAAVQTLIDASIDPLTSAFDARIAALDDRITALEGSSVATVLRGPRPAPPVPAGAKFLPSVNDTGNTDVRAQLQAALDDLEAGDVLVFAQGDTEGHQWPDAPVSTYRIEDSLKLSGLPDDVTLWGYGTRIRQHGSGEVMEMRTTGVAGLVIAGFEMMGDLGTRARTPGIYSAPGESNHGIGILRPSESIAIEDCWIHHNIGDGIYHPAWPAWDWRGVGTITVRHCRIEDNKRQGISPNVGTWHIHGNVLGNQGGFNVDLEDGKTSNYGLPRTDGIFEDNELWETGWASEAGVGLGPRHLNFTWGSNDADGPPNRQPCGPWIVRRNVIKGFVANTGTGEFVARRIVGQANTGSWSDYTRIDNPDARGYAFTVEDNIVDVPPDEQDSSRYLVRMRAVDGLYIDGNVTQGTTIDAPTSGYGANTDVSGSDV